MYVKVSYIRKLYFTLRHSERNVILFTEIYRKYGM